MTGQEGIAHVMHPRSGVPGNVNEVVQQRGSCYEALTLVEMPFRRWCVWNAQKRMWHCVEPKAWIPMSGQALTRIAYGFRLPKREGEVV